jgi:hypothetical protein
VYYIRTLIKETFSDHLVNIVSSYHRQLEEQVLAVSMVTEAQKTQGRWCEQTAGKYFKTLELFGMHVTHKLPSQDFSFLFY